MDFCLLSLGKGVSRQLNRVMPAPKKTHRIKKGRSKGKKLPKSKPEEMEQEVEINMEESCVPEHYKEETPIKRAVKMDPRSISNLPDEQRCKIKSEHPEMNEYFLMSARDKSKYFHILNQKYRQHMKLAEPPGSAPMKKTLKFKKRFEIRGFSHIEKCESVKATKSFMELYKARDQSKPKSISKFPKNT